MSTMWKKCYALASHLMHTHKEITPQEYYDKYIKKPSEGICKECGKPTTFRGLTKGYLEHCSSNCSNKSKDVVAKKKLTTLERFGDENFRNIEQSRATRLKLYGQFNSEECIKKISETKQNKTPEEIAAATEKSRATRESRYNQWRPSVSK